MKSPHQANAVSTPKPVTYAKGFTPAQPMASGRITPTSKKAANICACPPKG